MNPTKNLIIALALVLCVSCNNNQQKKPNFEVQQITSGPKHHLFGYIGHALTIPWNKSERYIVSLQNDFYKRMPLKGEAAEIILIDTKNDYNIIPVDKTYAWNLQQGTMLYWKPNSPETQFFFNDLDPETGLVFTVLYDIEKRERIREYRFENESIANGGVAPGGKYFARINYGKISNSRTTIAYAGAKDFAQEGPANPEDDGLFKVSIETGAKELLVSYKAIADYLKIDDPDYPIYVHHTLWNRNNDRIVFIVRGKGDDKKRRGYPNVGCVINSDGSGLGLIDFGGHPEWYKDNLLILPNDDKGILNIYNVDTKKVAGTIGEEGMFPDPGGDKAYSPDGKWLVGSHEKDEKQGYTFYRFSDQVHFTSPMIPSFQGTGDRRVNRVDGAPRWNRESNKILVGGIADDGSRQLFIIRMRAEKE
jgi:hypothetical protein